MPAGGAAGGGEERSRDRSRQARRGARAGGSDAVGHHQHPQPARLPHLVTTFEYCLHQLLDSAFLAVLQGCVASMQFQTRGMVLAS